MRTAARRIRVSSASFSALLAAFAAAAAAAVPDDAVGEALKAIETSRRAGELSAAAAAATELVTQHPESLEAHVAHQDLELALGHDRELLDAYRAAAKAPDASADAHYLCGRLLTGSQAIGELRAALKADAAHFWAACGLGAELTRTKAYAEAKSTLEDAARRRPDSAVPVNALGRIEEARGKTAEAQALYRAALEIDPNLTIARVNLGTLLLAEGKRDDAMKAFQDAAARDPRDPMPFIAIGMAQRDANDEKAALDSFRRAAAADPASVAAMNLVAHSYLELDQAEQADELLQRALKIAPRNLTTNVNLAYTRLKRDLFSEAERFATTAVDIDDQSAQAHHVLAFTYDRECQTKKADAEYKRAAKLDEDNPDIARAWAAFAASTGDWTRSVAEFQRAAKLVGNTYESLMELAGAYTGAGKAKSAASTYDQVLAADPSHLDAWMQLAVVCAKDLKENKRAGRALKEYQARGGKDPRVALWIKELEAK